MKSQEGFTLIEALVSFVILSGAIIICFESYASGLRALHQAQDALDAQLLSRSILTQALSREITNQAAESESAGKLRWTLVRRAISQTGASALHPVAIEVQVFDRQGRSIPSATLSTVMLERDTTP